MDKGSSTSERDSSVLVLHSWHSIAFVTTNHLLDFSQYHFTPPYSRSTVLLSWSPHQTKILMSFPPVICACCKKLGTYVAKIDMDVVYVAMAIYVCCKSMFEVFHVFEAYVVSVSSGCCICCYGYTRMFQVYDSSVSGV